MIAERLKHDESVQIDADHVAQLYIDLGAASAEAVLCKSMEDLALGLARIERYRSAGSVPEMLETAEKLEVVADRIGLQKLAGVARDVMACVESGEPTAIAATMGRLLRLGDQSLSVFWDPQDMSG
ncbi:MAG: hypothetical protein AAGH83_11305 [Pseudomonadota bacterium]